MRQCLIYNGSLRFSRATYGVLLLIAVLIHNQWLVLAVAILTILGAFSLKLNIPYQLHALVSKNKSDQILKELGELNFVAVATGVLLFIGFGFLYFNKFVDGAWIYLLVVDAMIFLACFVGFCVATLMYVFFKKIFSRNSK
ncbi:MAG: DUF4395 family protein [Patescibacteria group bacterium]|nr:DUF4395 family protein [Patescibacteria group bacterium]MDD4610858.1 DUF4395 family protein [Patescibacteria group bacterium]